MFRIFSLIYTVAAPTMAGAGVIAALVQPDYTAKMVIIAAIAGATLALPTAWIVANKISKL